MGVESEGRERGAEPDPSSSSLRGLDGLNFLMADVRDGLGPYLSVFLKANQNWNPGDIGLAMSASSIAAAVAQIPAGLVVDTLKAKRLLVAGSGLAVAAGCLLIAFLPKLPTVIAAQVLIGVASAIIPPALAALTLGLVGRRKLDSRISRNEGFNHAGNFTAALLAGTLGQYLGYDWIFYLVCAFAAASAAVVSLIRSQEIDHDLARGGETTGQDGRAARPISFRAMLTRRDFVVFLVAVTLFHFGNAAMLPMAGQVLAQIHPGTETIALSACIIAAQATMIGIAMLCGRAMAAGWGRKTIFLVAFAVLPLRGVLFTLTSDPYAVVAIQLLDGVAAGIFGVISIVMAADLMRGTGRFNVAQGLVALCIGLGASLSNLTSGYVIQWFGYPTGFLYLTIIAALGLLFFALLMPETRQAGRVGGGSTRPAGAPA